MNEFDKIWNETMGCGACDVKPSEDCVSREEVIRIAEQGQIQGYEWQFKKLCTLPSVKSNPVFYPPCEDCNTKMDEVRRAYDKLRDLQPCEDYISRQAVIDYAKDTCLDLDKYEDTEVFCDEIKALPSVTPTSEAIKEAYLKGYDYGVKDWFKSKTQPCEDCISREEVRRILSNEVFELMKLHTVNPEDNPKADAMAYGVNWSLNTLMELPSVTPERPNPDVVEKMKKVIDEMTEIHSDGEFYIKNVDAKWIINKYLYGAEMSGGGEDEVSN